MTGREGAIAGIRESIAHAIQRLDAADIADEALAAFTAPKRVLFIARKPVMVPLARVWPLGVVLLGRGGDLYATGKITRAVPPGYPGYQSPGVETRRGYRAAAFAGDFAEGDTVNFDTAEIDLDALGADSSPVFIGGDRARVRWNPLHPSQSVAFDAYFADRVGLLVDFAG